MEIQLSSLAISEGFLDVFSDSRPRCVGLRARQRWPGIHDTAEECLVFVALCLTQVRQWFGMTQWYVCLVRIRTCATVGPERLEHIFATNSFLGRALHKQALDTMTSPMEKQLKRGASFRVKSYPQSQIMSSIWNHLRKELNVAFSPACVRSILNFS